MISAEIVCDSISPQGKRLTTFKLRYPKFIHGEFMTHRVISRNASSSRAIPTKKLLEEVRSDALRAAPVFWGKNQSGMQAAEELDNIKALGSERAEMVLRNRMPITVNMLTELEAAQNMWATSAEVAACGAESLLMLGVHKQIVNRLLEPFSHINVVATATEWDNFFGLRLHKDAQPEMRALAECMWDALQESHATLIGPGEWHLPFVTPDDWRAIWPDAPDGMNPHEAELEAAIRISVARCARVSYESFETGKRSTIEEDLRLYARLTAGLSDPTQPLHASPMEHQATPDDIWTEGISSGPYWKNSREHGNFVGWRQYRKMLPNEAVAPLPKEFT